MNVKTSRTALARLLNIGGNQGLSNFGLHGVFLNQIKRLGHHCVCMCMSTCTVQLEHHLDITRKTLNSTCLETFPVQGLPRFLLLLLFLLFFLLFLLLLSLVLVFL